MLFAVHIDNNVLAPSWEWGGFVLAALLVATAAWRLHEDEIPRIALLTAAFFVASSMHIRLPGASVHLLLNGLVGVVLGWRSALAIFVGLLLQAVLLGHGGFLALGVNTCIITVPALLSWLLFQGLHRLPIINSRGARLAIVALSAEIWLLSCVAAVSLLWFHVTGGTLEEATERTINLIFHPAIRMGTLGLAGIAALIEERLENAPEFALGLLVGVIAVLLTVACNCAVLIAGGQSFGPTPPLILAVLHLPVAAIEGIILGFTVGFLARVKPELLGLRVPP